MKKLDFTLEKKDGGIVCQFLVTSSCQPSTITLTMNGDILHEKTFGPLENDIWSWYWHPFLNHYHDGDIKVLRNYFSYKDEIECDLFYIHPTKCGGSSIEQTGYEYGVRWGRWSLPKYDYHKTSEYFIKETELIKNKTLFTSVRNPYERIVSAVYCPYNRVKHRETKKEYSLEDFNNIIRERIIYNMSYETYPLYDFVYHKDKKIVPHVLKLENLTEDFNRLMFDYNSDIRMEKTYNKNGSYYKGKKYGVEDISLGNIKLINEKYKKDFIYFDYEMI